MLRCAFKACLAVALPFLGAHVALAQGSRPFPVTALRGTLQVVQPPEVLINGQADRLSPGARIRGADNMLHLSGTLVGQPLLVHYSREPSTGLVHQVWILTADEASRKPWPTTLEQAQRWDFNPAAQVWTRR